MRNPWVELPMHAPFILPCDAPIVRKYDSPVPSKRVRAEVLPVPFLGDFKRARVVILSLNPGFVDDDVLIFHNDKKYVEANRRTLTFESDPPFFILSEDFSYTPGYRWWNSRLGPLIAKFGRERVSKSVMCIQYFPYHSEAYHRFGELVPSQGYSFSLLRSAMRERKLVVIARSTNLWLQAVPELASYPYLETRSPRSHYISAGNIRDDRFNEVIQAIE